MKSILKNINSKLDLDYDQTFTSEKNTKICCNLVKKLRLKLQKVKINFSDGVQLKVFDYKS